MAWQWLKRWYGMPVVFLATMTMWILMVILFYSNLLKSSYHTEPFPNGFIGWLGPAAVLPVMVVLFLVGLPAFRQLLGEVTSRQRWILGTAAMILNIVVGSYLFRPQGCVDPMLEWTDLTPCLATMGRNMLISLVSSAFLLLAVRPLCSGPADCAWVGWYPKRLGHKPLRR